MDWTTVENAIATWVATGGATMWSDDDGPRPATPFVRMSIDGLLRRGVDAVTVEDAATPTAGAEIEHKVRGPRKLVLTLQCFATSPTGTGRAIAILETIIASARLPTVRAALTAAKLGLGPVGAVKSMGGVINTANFEPRATVEIHLHTVAEQSEFGTYIETVESEGTVT
jgi:hypothetical protein